MNRYFRLAILCTLSSVFVTACQESVLEETGNGKMRISMIAATDTKTSIDGSNCVNWGTGEYVSMFYDDGSVKFVKSDDSSADAFSGASTAQFDFTISPAAAASYQIGGVYPSSAISESENSAENCQVTLPSIQNATANSYDPAAYIMTIKPETVETIPTTWTAKFRRATALNKITLTDVAQDVKSVEITAHGKKFAGVRTIDLTTDTSGAISGNDTTITVEYETALSAGDIDIWFTCWGTEIASGEKLTVKVFGTTETYTKTISAKAAGISFKENKLNTLEIAFGSVPADVYTIGDFAREYVKVIDIWKENVGKINLLTGEASGDAGYDVNYAHYIPQSTTIKVGAKTYSTADMLEIALRSYLLLSGYNGNNTTASGAEFNSLTLPGSTMSGTAIPTTHSYVWGTSPYSETSGNGGYLSMTAAPGLVKSNLLYNWACRNTNYPITHSSLIANISGYNGGQLAGYTGSCCPKRALITYAYFFKYMLDEGLEDATSISSDQMFITDLFGLDLASESSVFHNGIWVWGSSMSTLPLGTLATNGIGSVFILNPGVNSDTKLFIKRAQNLNIKVHIWVKTFNDGEWINPVDVANECYNQSRFDDVIALAKDYIDLGADGIHFDYIRYPGTPSNKAELFSYKGGTVTGIGAITEFCHQANTALKAKKPDVYLSAAVMAETGGKPYYGQDPEGMGQYLDFIVPMSYRYYDGGDRGTVWLTSTVNYFVTKSAPAKVWAGATTYTGESSITPMNASDILADCQDIVDETNAVGVVLFRYGIGEIPNLRNLWK